MYPALFCFHFEYLGYEFREFKCQCGSGFKSWCAKGKFFHDTGEGSISPYHLEHGGDIVWEIGSGYFGCRTLEGQFDPVKFAEKAKLPQVKMIEIKLSQGAKPGHGDFT